MKLNKVRYVNNNGVHIYVNEEEVHGVVSFSFEHRCNEVPKVKIERYASTDDLSVEAAVDWVNRADEIKKKMCAGYCKYADNGGAMCPECPLVRL